MKEIPDIVQETEAVYAFDEEGGYSPPWYKDLTRNVSLRAFLSVVFVQKRKRSSAAMLSC